MFESLKHLPLYKQRLILARLCDAASHVDILLHGTPLMDAVKDLPEKDKAKFLQKVYGLSHEKTALVHYKHPKAFMEKLEGVDHKLSVYLKLLREKEEKIAQLEKKFIAEQKSEHEDVDILMYELRKVEKLVKQLKKKEHVDTHKIAKLEERVKKYHAAIRARTGASVPRRSTKKSTSKKKKSTKKKTARKTKKKASKKKVKRKTAGKSAKKKTKRKTSSRTRSRKKTRKASAKKKRSSVSRSEKNNVIVTVKHVTVPAKRAKKKTTTKKTKTSTKKKAKTAKKKTKSKSVKKKAKKSAAKKPKKKTSKKSTVNKTTTRKKKTTVTTKVNDGSVNITVN